MSQAKATAVVAGAARPDGLGRAIALRLAADGARVACLDHPGASADLDDLVRELSTRGTRAVAVTADLTDATAVDAAVASATAALGTIDTAICAAVAPGPAVGPIIALDPSQVARVIDAELKAAWLVCRAAARRMTDAGTGGRLVLVSSVAGRVGSPSLGPHAAAAGGVLVLARAFAAELADAQVTANAVCLPLGPDGPLPVPAAVDLIAFLCSDAGHSVSGEAIAIAAGTRTAAGRPQGAPL